MTASLAPPEPRAQPEDTRTEPSARPGPTRPRARKSKAHGALWLVILLIIVGVAGYAVWRAGRPLAQQNTQNAPNGGGRGGSGRGGRGGGTGPVPVVVTNVTRSTIPVVLKGLGNVTAFYTVTVKPRVDGQLMRVDFHEGDLVKEGQVLAEIDPRPFQVQLDLAQATRAKDQAMLKNARLDVERYQQLIATDAAPRQQLDTQMALVAQYEATVAQDTANIDNARLQLTYAKITAPIDGVVGLRLIDPGNIVHASDATGIIVITQLQPISVLFTIPEDSLPQVTRRLRAGAQLTVEAYNRDDSKKLATGRLVTVDNQIDNTTGTSKLKAVFDNADRALFPQQFVNIHLLVESLANQLVVPNVAVQNGQQGTFVYVVDQSSKVHLQTVQVGLTTSTSSDILSGLAEGSRVVVDGTDRLVEGAAVRVRKPGELDNPPDFDTGGRGGGRGGAGRGGQRREEGDAGRAALDNPAGPPAHASASRGQRGDAVR
jgi:multidrug efflux system membrane fusion protein